MKDYKSLADWQRMDIDRNILKGNGEMVDITYTDLEEVEISTEPVEEGSRKKVSTQKVLRPVERTLSYYVGKMGAGGTGGLLSILGSVFANGANLKEMTGREDNVAFLEYLDEYNLTLLLKVVLREDEEGRKWIQENWDVAWVIPVIVTFFRYNDFFALVNQLGSVVAKMNITEESARTMALGKSRG